MQKGSLINQIDSDRACQQEDQRLCKVYWRQTKAKVFQW